MGQKELKKLIALNNEEAGRMVNSYFLEYVKAILMDKNANNGKILITKLKEYLQIIKRENSYYKYLLKNFAKIRNEDAYDDLLFNLDILNEKSYLYYDHLLEDYEQNKESNYNFVSSKDFKSLIERKDYEEKTVSLVMSFEDVFRYFSNEDAVYYLVTRTKILKDASDYYGCYLIEDKGIIKDVNICVPPVDDWSSLLINIYLYQVGIIAFNNIGKLANFSYNELANNAVLKFKEKQLVIDK